ncbi:MAG: hypothetical protein A4E37_00951 [Methanoregulaceae archaeon PtaB.Bin056]|nr:MAG: hypothetical protein A4E37_00951 [Methanoregulaceae archaeon PtaB.Bin056]
MDVRAHTLPLEFIFATLTPISAIILQAEGR